MHTTIDLKQAQQDGRVMSFKYAPESRPLDGYTIKRAIQRGGFGEVYYALSDAGKEVALKLLQDNLDVELRGVAQCLNLKHANLMTIFDVRRSAIGEHWVVMEYMSGQTLDQVIASSPTGVPYDRIRSLLTDMAAGLGYLHDQGLVHRDLKPANVFVENGSAKIGDVGLSKFISVSQRSAQTQSVGTVYYMAPEIAHGKYGREVDVYALGVMLYEMLTGKLPFDGETTGEILMKHLTQPPDLSKVPANLRAVIARALEKDPTKRTPTAQQLVADFNAATGGEARAWRQAPQPQLRTSSNDEFDNRGSHEHAHHPSSTASFWRGFAGTLACVGACLFLGLMMETGQGRVSWMAMISLGFMLWGGFALGRHWLGVGLPAVLVPGHYNRGVRLNSSYQRAISPESIRAISFTQRSADLTGSMAVACVVAGLVAAVLLWLNTFLKTPAQATFFAVTTTLGAWAAMIPAKVWEGRGGDGTVRRLATAAFGSAVGVAASSLDKSLMIGLPISELGATGHFVGSRMQITDTAATHLIGCALFFTLLMVARRWWYHVDALRDRRLNFTTVIATTIAAVLIAFVTRFPMDWAVMWGMAISTTAQLSSAWVSSNSRTENDRRELAGS
jgi:hypothetical protein